MVGLTLKQCDSCHSPFGPHIFDGVRCDVCDHGRVHTLGVPKMMSVSTDVDITSELAPHPLHPATIQYGANLLPAIYHGIEHPELCKKCNHAAEMHSQWGICDVLDCGPCCEHLVCGVCKHKIGDHWNAKDDVVCLISKCKQAVCYSIDDDSRDVPGTEAGEIQLIERFVGEQYAA